MNHQSDDRNREAPTPMCSRRSFMRVAAASGGAGLLSAGLLPTIVQARVGSPSQVVLPPATPEIAPFKVHVPQAVLEDLKATLRCTPWPIQEPPPDRSPCAALANGP